MGRNFYEARLENQEGVYTLIHLYKWILLIKVNYHLKQLF